MSPKKMIALMGALCGYVLGANAAQPTDDVDHLTSITTTIVADVANEHDVDEPDASVSRQLALDVQANDSIELSHREWVDSTAAFFGGFETKKKTSYIERRGMFNREDVKNVFIPKGQWVVGGHISWNQWDNENLNYLVLKDINFRGHSFSTGPYFGYFFADNLAVGGRLTYKRGYFNLGEFDLNLGEDFNIGLEDLYYLQHSYKATSFLRSYMPIGNSKVFGLLGELQLNYTFSEGKNSTGREETLTMTYDRTNELEIGLAGGMSVFITNWMAAEVMLNVGGYRVKWGEQNTNNMETGRIRSSGASFKFNLFSIQFGISYFL